MNYLNIFLAISHPLLSPAEQTYRQDISNFDFAGLLFFQHLQ